ncbi:MAG TPA: cytochrome c peroxidase [Kofleriaceae bacterium]
MGSGFLLVTGCGDETKLQPDAAPRIDAPVDAPEIILTTEEIAATKLLSPLPEVPADTTNAFANDAAAAALGQKLFFDKSYSGALAIADNGTNGGLGKVGDTGKVSCASCHSAGSPGLDDQRSTPNNVSLGTDFGTRNALNVVSSSFYAWTNWGGRFDSQWSLPLAVAENARIMKSSRLQLAHMLYAKYRTEYDAIFPVALDPDLDPAAPNAARFPPTGKPKAAPTDPDGPWELMAPADRDIVNRIFANYGKAVAAYMRKLVSRDAPFDRFVAGDESAISVSAIRGIKVFLNKGCVTCHGGPTFSDASFHALAVPQLGPNVPMTDLGRFQDVPGLLASPFNSNGAFSDDITTGRLTGLVQVDSQKGQFRTRSLRNVAGSGAFMHSGQFATLADVITFYDQGGGDVGTSGIVKDPLIVQLSLSAQDKLDLVAFLETLTGEPVPPRLLVDTSK